MLTSITPKSIEALKNFIRTGSVAQIDDANHIRVRIQHEMRFIEVWCSFAMGNMPLPQVGDRVLVAGEDYETGFIIGHFPTTPAPAAQQSFTLEQDKKTGKTTLTVPKGDLDLCSEQGSINLRAAKKIEMSSPQFDLDAGKGNINIADAKYKGLRLAASVEQTKLFFGKLNSTVGRLIEKAKSAYRQVDNLNQLKAGRMRTLVNGSYHLKSERIVEKADKDVRIDGEKINLG
ncbi:DUF3540 domain-containing protein [Alteromonadaceae bacterium BrNp21-10]|nr:DUF3540 domain-containing protein [Alteromonadaceae bacterium BrNp21-10]